MDSDLLQTHCVADEEKGWAITERELEERRTAAVEKNGFDIRALTLINPGNPTGQVLSREDLEIICKFCAKYDIVLLADEVYQRNIYDENKEFVSAKKVAIETPGCENLQLISFHSTSKGTCKFLQHVSETVYSCRCLHF